MSLFLNSSSFVFFQAEDGIRYLTVTGVQTCALPIYPISLSSASAAAASASASRPAPPAPAPSTRTSSSRCACASRRASGAGIVNCEAVASRSEERRVGEEGRFRWSPDHLKKKNSDRQ